MRRVQIGLFTPFLQGYLAGVFFGWLGLGVGDIASSVSGGQTRCSVL
jgi:hypothetical protein